MKTILSPGECVSVEFENSDVGRFFGSILVSFTEKEITVYSDLPDSSGRKGIVYREEFGSGLPAPNLDFHD